MTRARARALETEVTSLLNELPYESCETWLLPQTEMLCMLRYLEDPSEDAREDGQVPKSTDEEERRKELENSENDGRSWRIPQDPDIRPQAPDIRPLEHLPQPQPQPQPSLQGPDIRTSASRGQKVPADSPDIRPRARTSGPSRDAGHPAPARTSGALHRTDLSSGPRQPGHPAIGPDIRLPAKARTSGLACLRTVKGRGPCTPSPT
jgi:hypothetical protein